MKVVQQEEVLQYCIANKLSFAISRLPNSNQSQLIISKHTKQLPLKEAIQSDGFVLAPFAMHNEQVVFLNADWEIGASVNEAEFDAIKQLVPASNYPTDEHYIANYEAYAEQFSALMTAINKDGLSKAILSRIKPNASINKQQAHRFYYALEKAYQQAYVFMFYSPESGLWAGASPELLLNVEGRNATTVSLAGTRKSDNLTSAWGDKEIIEQQIVSDYVGDLLQHYNISDYEKDGPHTINAGKMVHLKTTYQFNPEALNGNLGSFINALHPTPAVCGLPKQQALDTILNIEQHNRGFYAGFLGRVTSSNISLYVNIRSLQFVNNGVNLYLGGGITKDSDVAMEWNETELKAQTMLNVIESIVN